MNNTMPVWVCTTFMAGDTFFWGMLRHKCCAASVPNVFRPQVRTMQVVYIY